MAAPATVTSEINGLYVTLYGVPATNAGLTYWINTLAAYDPTINLGNAGTTPISLADQIYLGIQMTAGSPIVNGTTYFATLYPASITDTQYVEDLYQNMAGFNGTAGGVQYWFQQLQQLESQGDTVIQAREAIAGEFVHDFMSDNLTVGAAALGLSQTDWQLLVAGQQALLNKVSVSEDWSVTTAGNPGSILNYTSVNSPAFAAGQELLKDITSDPHSVVLADNAIAAANASDSLTPILNLVIPPAGQTFDLTTGIDNIKIGTIGTADHVEGLIDTKSGTSDSTYTVGDNVQGNGFTVVDLAVVGSGTNSAALATLSGVSTVNFFMGTTDDVTVNAALWNNVNNVTESGAAGDVTVHNLNVSNGNGLKLAITTTKAATLSATGHVSGLSYSASVESGKGVGTVATFGTAGVNVVVAKSGDASVSLYQKVEHTSAGQGAASVGDISIGNVNVNVGANADGSVTVGNEVYAYSHNATAGNITVGTVNYTVAKSGDGGFEVYNEAYVYGALGGNATVGNVTVGNVAAKVAAGGEFNAYFYGEVSVRTGPGNGTVGDLTVGNISMTGADQYVNIYRYVNDSVSGNATVGNVTVGNISMIGGTADQEFSLEYNGADAVKGNAKVGNVTIGNVNMTGNYYLDFDIDDQGALVRDTGAATSGNVAIGSVAMHAKASADIYFYVDNYAEAGNSGGKGGVATGGNVTIGNVTMTGSAAATMKAYNIAGNYGSKSHNATGGNISIGNITTMQIVGTTGAGAAITGASNKITIENYATAYHGNASVGSIVVGNISANVGAPSVQASAVVDVFIENGAKATHGKATVGTVTVGNVALDVGLAGSAKLTVENYAIGNTTADSTGLVKVGNVSMQGGSGAKLHAYIENYAYATAAVDHIGTTGGISVGNVAMALTKALGTAQLFVSETGGAAGQVTVGNVSLQGHTGSKLEATVFEFAGKGGTAAGITVGNVSITGAKATASLSVSATGATTGKVSVGNVTLSAGKVHLSITNDATGGNAGGISVGNVTLKGNSAGLNYISQHASNGNAGALTVGNISLTIGKAQNMKLLVTDTAAHHVGALTIGNVALAVGNTKAGALNHVTLDIQSSSTGHLVGGNIAVGNIAISAGGTKSWTVANDQAVHVTITSADGTVSVGNISASGGVIDKAGTAVVDNFADFSNGSDGLTPWFKASGTSHPTVGNIDYSGYAGLGAYSSGTVDGIAANAVGTLIDVNTLKGAPSIVGSTGGTAIVDNSGQNAIDVSHTTKADIILLQDSQTAVSDTGGVVTAPQASVDSITGLHSGDVIGFAAGNFATGLGLTGTTPPTQAGASTYANFLASAETAIDTNGYAFYSADVGGNTYVAMNHGGHVVEVVEVMGVHTFTVDGSNFLHFAT